MTTTSATPPTQADVNFAYNVRADAMERFYDALTLYMAVSRTGTYRERNSARTDYMFAKRVHRQADAACADVAAAFEANR